MTLTEPKCPPLLSRQAASEMTGLDERYLDKLRRLHKVRTYLMLGGGKHLFYRDELLEHLGLKLNQCTHDGN